MKCRWRRRRRSSRTSTGRGTSRFPSGLKRTADGRWPIACRQRFRRRRGSSRRVMKVVFAAAGLPVCAYSVVLRHDWQQRRDAIAADLEAALGYPMFVKPANLGSSVGISKAKTRAGLVEGMDLAGAFDRKIVIE